MDLNCFDQLFSSAASVHDVSRWRHAHVCHHHPFFRPKNYSPPWQKLLSLKLLSCGWPYQLAARWKWLLIGRSREPLGRSDPHATRKLPRSCLQLRSTAPANIWRDVVKIMSQWFVDESGQHPTIQISSIAFRSTYSFRHLTLFKCSTNQNPDPVLNPIPNRIGQSSWHALRAWYGICSTPSCIPIASEYVRPEWVNTRKWIVSLLSAQCSTISFR